MNASSGVSAVLFAKDAKKGRCVLGRGILGPSSG